MADDAVLVQIIADFRRELLWFDEVMRVFQGYQQIAHDDRIAVYVASTEVECPGYFVKSG